MALGQETPAEGWRRTWPLQQMQQMMMMAAPFQTSLWYQICLGLPQRPVVHVHFRGNTTNFQTFGGEQRWCRFSHVSESQLQTAADQPTRNPEPHPAQGGSRRGTTPAVCPPHSENLPICPNPTNFPLRPAEITAWYAVFTRE